MRNISKISPDWWDYTTLDTKLLDNAARLTIDDLPKLQRKGFKINIYDTLQEFYCAEALEYIEVFKQATAAHPCGVCGPIGPTEQLPLVAQMVNAMGISLKHAHFWGMDEWIVDGKAADRNFPWASRRPIWNCASTASTPSWPCPKKTCTSPPNTPKNT